MPSLAPAPPLATVVDVLDYGAKFDNSTDDTAAIQAALDAAVIPITGLSGNDVPRRIVQLPPGRGKVQGTLTIPANTMLRGHGLAGTYLVRSGGGTGTAVLAVTAGSVEQTIADLGIICNDNAVDCIDLTGSNTDPSILADGHVVVRDVALVGGNRGILAPNGTEHRFARVACYRQYWGGMFVTATDCWFEGCTVAAPGQKNNGGAIGNVFGIAIRGANHRVYGCKVFGLVGVGWGSAGISVGGAGRNQIVCCEVQDCEGDYAFLDASNYPNVFSGCVADSCKGYGFVIGGGAAEQHSAGVGLHVTNRPGGLYTFASAYRAGSDGTILRGCTTYNARRFATSHAQIQGLADVDNRCGQQSLAYAAAITPNPWKGGDIFVAALTGNLTINAPADEFDGAGAFFQIGQRLTFLLTQDGTGGRAVTFNAAYKTTAAIDTTASSVTLISFVFDGTNWREVSRAKT